MFVNPLFISNLIPLSFLIGTYLYANTLYSNQKFLSVFRPDGKPHFGESHACANLIKAIQCMLCFSALAYIYATDVIDGNYPNVQLRSIIMIYAAVEILGMVKARKFMRKDLIYHHYSAIFLSLLAFGVDFNKNKVGQFIVLFLFIICATFLNNIYFALKVYKNVDWLLPYAKWSYIPIFFGYVIYTIFKWEYGVSEMFKWLLFYWVFMSPLFYANIQAIRFLFKETKSIKKSKIKSL
jgi:hypothetical protein